MSFILGGDIDMEEFLTMQGVFGDSDSSEVMGWISMICLMQSM